MEALGREWRQVIRQWTGITCGIGFGPSKTLAKLANHAAKQYPKTGGVVDLSDPVRQRRLLAITPVEEVWGIGRRLGQHLRALGIQTALQLADSHPGWIRQRFNVVLARTVAELNGQSCLQLEEVRPPKQQIISSRSFSNAITDPETLCEAVAAVAGGTPGGAGDISGWGQICQGRCPALRVQPGRTTAAVVPRTRRHPQ